MADQSLGDYLSQYLYGAPTDAQAQQFALPQFQQRQVPMPQFELNSNIPGALPEVSGRLNIPTALGDLSASGRYQPPMQEMRPEWGVRFGFTRRF